MTKDLKNAIKSIQPEFNNNQTYSYNFPSEVSLYVDNDEYQIDLYLSAGSFTTSIYVGEDRYKVTEEDAEFIHSYLTELLDYQIELTERYYEGQMHYERERYNDFGSFYIR